MELKNKIYAIGDIHGQLHKLKGLIEKLPIDDTCQLVFVGDYTDRGEHSFEVIEYLINLCKRYNCVFLKGNHEDLFMNFMLGESDDVFVCNGGDSTIQSYKNNGYDISQFIEYQRRNLPITHVNFYKSLKNYYETDDYIFVHAGLLPKNIPLSEQPVDVLLWVRYDFINSDFDWGKKVIFGHTPNREILNMHNKICIDTGAYYEGGKLTCVVLPEEKFIQQ